MSAGGKVFEDSSAAIDRNGISCTRFDASRNRSAFPERTHRPSRRHRWLEESAKVLQHDVGSPLGWRAAQVVLGRDACQHERCADADCPGSRDVGVEPVADEQRRPGSSQSESCVEHGSTRFARVYWLTPDRGLHCLDQCAVAGRFSLLERQREIGVRGDPRDAAVIGGSEHVARLGEISPRNRRIEALHYRIWRIGCGPHNAVSGNTHRHGETQPADYEHGRSRRHSGAQQFDNDLRAADDVGFTGMNAQPAKMRSYLRRRS